MALVCRAYPPPDLPTAFTMTLRGAGNTVHVACDRAGVPYLRTPGRSNVASPTLSWHRGNVTTPAALDYIVARSAEVVLAALAEGDTRVLAGGQSLVLDVTNRDARPRRVVDINRVKEFDSLTGPFTTVRRREELLVEVRLPLLPSGTGVGYAEHRPHQVKFAEVAAIAAVTVADGLVSEMR